MSAIRGNPWLKALYGHLTRQGKPAKPALVAVLRGMLPTLNAMVKRRAPQNPGLAASAGAWPQRLLRRAGILMVDGAAGRRGGTAPCGCVLISALKRRRWSAAAHAQGREHDHARNP